MRKEEKGMNVMQSLVDFKQNLQQQAHSAVKAAAALGAAQPAARPFAAVPADTNSSSSSDSTTITANDFLQLLVAEMKNQDPTADQDPNAYIDQLVQVNSLQQLIAINQDLTVGASTGTTSSSAVGPTPTANAAHRPSQQLGSAADSPATTVATALVPRPARPEQAPGADSVSGTLPASAPGPTSGPARSPFNSPSPALLRR
jgi:flagellar basal-body rod modification protein FlgD